LKHLRVPFVPVYAHEPTAKRKKLDMKSKLGIFIGYGEGSKGYKVFDTVSRKVGVYRDVVFVESSHPIQEGICTTCGQKAIEKVRSSATIEIEEPIDRKDNTQKITSSRIKEIDNEPLKLRENESEETEGTTYRRSSRIKENALAAQIIDEDPKTYQEAMRSENHAKWNQAMIKELESIKDNGTWEEVKSLPEGANLVSSKWVFKTKLGPKGEVIEYKARIVARGFTQEYGRL
jgi:hypothetical protein